MSKVATPCTVNLTSLWWLIAIITNLKFLDDVGGAENARNKPMNESLSNLCFKALVDY